MSQRKGFTRIAQIKSYAGKADKKTISVNLREMIREICVKHSS
jgi:hypothetical protein